jgi:ribosomal protein L37AE/L43A
MMNNDFYKLLPKLKFRSDNGIKRDQVCPVCGRKRVNIYLRGSEWKCKKCWDGEDVAKGNA